jgi:hypothetical protein
MMAETERHWTLAMAFTQSSFWIRHMARFSAGQSAVHQHVVDLADQGLVTQVHRQDITTLLASEAEHLAPHSPFSFGRPPGRA